MALTREKEESLSALFSVWGLDGVREEMENEAHSSLISPDIIEFAHRWVVTEEARRKRQSRYIWLLLMIAASLITGAGTLLLASAT